MSYLDENSLNNFGISRTEHDWLDLLVCRVSATQASNFNECLNAIIDDGITAAD